MTDFVLVHGSGQNADSWSRVGRILESSGHRVSAPDLPKQKPEWGLEEYAAEIAKSVSTPGTVVVGHSMSGAFLPLVPAMRECACLVFVAAVVPEPGKSVRDQFAEDSSMFHREWIDAGPRWFDKSQEEGLAREFLFHDCDGETLPWALETVELLATHNLAEQPSPLAEWPAVRTASIVATLDRTLTPDWGRKISRRVLGVDAMEVEAGHCPQVSRAAEIADLLAQIASTGND